MSAMEETLPTGPDVTAFEAVDLAVMAGVSGSSGGGSGDGASPLKARMLPSFALYYDAESESVKVASPKVIYGGSEISVDISEFDFSSGGTVVCLVWKKDGVFHAKVAADGSSVDGNVVAKVPIAQIDNPNVPSGFRQLHVGAVIVYGEGGEGEPFIASFTAYDNSGSIDLFEPLVAAPDGIHAAAGTVTGLTAGTYYCHVKRAKSTGAYSATVDTSENDATVTSQEEAVVTTKVCKIGTSGEGTEQKTVVDEQYHVGTIVVDGGGGGEHHLPGCFEIRPPKTNGESDPGGFDNPYYTFGGRIYAASNVINDHEHIGLRNVIVAVVVTLSGSSPVASIAAYDSFAGMQIDADDPDLYVHPLYEFGPNGEVKCDLRNIPTMVGKEWMS